MNVSIGLALSVVAYFAPQPAPGPLTLYSVQVCASESAIVPGGKLYAAAQSRIYPVTRASAQAELHRAARRSGWRTAGLVAETLLWAGTAAEQGGIVKVREGHKAALPIVAGLLRVVTTATAERRPSADLPVDLVPSTIQIGAGQCVEQSMFARRQQDETTFSVEVK